MAGIDAKAFRRLREGLTRTREQLTEGIVRAFTASSTMDDAVAEKLEESLIAGDVGVETTERVMEAIRKRVKEDRFANAQELQQLIHDVILRAVSAGGGAPDAEPFALVADRPHVTLLVGVNGSGKTTTIGKLAHAYRGRGHRVTIGASDTFRAAAGEQLEVWAERAGATLIRQGHGSDPSAVAFDAVRSAAARDADVVLIDTAGRLHTRVSLMDELRKIKRVIGKARPNAPHEVLLVLDASTGQNGLQQAIHFDAAVGITGLVLTKLDGTARGGIVLAIAARLNIPVRFIGVGEGLDDLHPFDGKAYVDALFTS